MSKIEEALKRARLERSLPVPQSGMPTGRKPAGVVSSQNREGEGLRGTDLVLRERSAETIAKMRNGALAEASTLVERKIIVPDPKRDGAADAFREIRTKILRKAHGKNCSIMVTSVIPRCGNSFVAVNLSVAFALDAAKTALLIECNLRSPVTSKLLPMVEGEQLLGLTDYLERSDLDIGSVIHPSGIERFRVMPAGQPREIPSEYFMSSRMRSLVATVRTRYPDRFVILDAPAMTQAADAQTLAEMADYVILVVPYGRVTNAQIDSCLEGIDPNKLVGIVFNDEPRIERDVWSGIPDGAARCIRTWTSSVGHRISGAWSRITGRKVN